MRGERDSDSVRVSADGHGWLVSFHGWFVLYVTSNGVAVNDLRRSVAFTERAAFTMPVGCRATPRAVQGATPAEVMILVEDGVIASVTIDPARPTHAEVVVLDPLTGSAILDRNVRYRQLPPSPAITSAVG